MYHNIAEEANFNTVSHRCFEEQVRMIMSERRIVSLDEYVRQLNAGGTGSGIAVITFDDAYVSFRLLALPILEKYALPAALFVPMGHPGGTNTWEREGSPVFSLLNPEEIGETAGHELVTIGSHGLSHRSLRRLPKQEQGAEITDSKRALETLIGREVRHFSYPYGQRVDFSSDTIRLVRESGYRSACSTLYGRTNRARQRYALRRIEVRPQDSLDRFKKLCSSNLHLVYVKQRVKEVLHALTV